MNSLLRLFRIHRAKPYVSVVTHGQLTDNPKISVSVCSNNGATTVQTWPDTEAGRALARLHARTLSHILQIPLWEGDAWEYGSHRD